MMLAILVIMPVIVINTGNETASASDVVSQFMDCIQPMPIVDSLKSDCWGSGVGPNLKWIKTSGHLARLDI